MSHQSSNNNKRIAKNTLLLYIRMFLTMAVSLYTSRVVLKTLGVVDYGIYNVVGGIVVMFGFINSCMSSATQRFITFALGKGDMKRLQTVFSTSLQIHVIIAAIVFVLCESVGLWFFYTQMQIPAERMTAAMWVLQCSVLSTMVMFVSVPYNADIIAHEKMSAFAYISILEVLLKLAILFVLVLYPIDKLILYAILLLVVQVIIRFCYSIYCDKHFEESKYKRIWDGKLFKEMVAFAGWSLWGHMSSVFNSQGLNMLLNVFFGPVVNAARAVAVQVQSAIMQFTVNFQMALNPQIMKTYARGEMEEMHKLIFRSGRFSFYLIFFISLPVLFETNFILSLWLGEVPENTVVFVRIILCTSILTSISNPLMVACGATGKVKKYQAVCGGLLLTILPISWVALKFGCPAWGVFVVHFLVECICLFARMILLRPLIGIKVMSYIRNIWIRIIVVAGLSPIIPAIAYLKMDDTVLRFFIIGFLCVVSVALFTYTFGFTKHERLVVTDKIQNKVLGLIHKNA